MIRGRALVEANRADVINKQRIAIYTEFDDADPVEVAIIGAKLRHELRHAEQHLSPENAEIFSLADLAEHIVLHRVGGLPGGP